LPDNCIENPRPTVEGFVQIKAFSKINLNLEVLERRADNYHNIRSVMQSLDLHDTLTIKTETRAGDNPFIQLECNNPTLPVDERNLVYQAADYMVKKYGIRQPVRIRIDKRIPVAAGLGGGSSDCAATLVGMNQIFGLGLTAVGLREMGLRFGADVPFNVTGGTMLAEGVGEVLTELTPYPSYRIVLACLPIAVSTKEIFDRLAEIRTKADYVQNEKKLNNDLTPITSSLHPEINELITRMKRLGASDADMSGSGPSVYGLFESERAAQTAAQALNETIKNVYITRPERMRLI